MNWHTREDGHFDMMPPRRNESITSVEVWFALSDGRVVRGEVLYTKRGDDAAVHSWFLSSDDQGNPARHIACESPAVQVEAWKLIEVPQHPRFARASALRRLL
jgi:hypothetical protein